MLDQFKTDLILYKKRKLLFALFSLVSFLFGFCVFLIITQIDPIEKWICLGTMLSLFPLLVFPILDGIYYPQEFSLALSMGRTRKAFMVSYALREILWLILTYLLILGLYGIEHTVFTLMYPGYEEGLTLSFLFNWKLVAVVILGLTVLSMFIGAMYSRFGKKFLVILYFAWMALCILGPKAIPDESHTGVLAQFARSIVSWVQRFPERFWLIVAVTVIAAMTGTTIHLGKKHMVH